MAVLHDFHLHSYFSGDSTAPMEEMIKSALDKGLKGICITEHYDVDYPVYKEAPDCTFMIDFPAYRAQYLEMLSKYQDKLDFGFGIELGLQPHLAETYYKLLEEYPFDFVIGSIHTCYGHDPYFPPFFEGISEEEAYRKYFTGILENLEVYDGFDTFGHLDYVVRYGPNKDKFYTYERYQDLLDPILTKLISMGKALECNTGAINYGLKSLNPSREILERYRELGGEQVTIGSDAHRPDALAKGLDVARDLLLDCGFTHYTTFQNRMPRMHKL